MVIDTLRQEVTNLIDTDALGRQQWLDTLGDKWRKGIDAILDLGGDRAEAVKSWLHGTWLGHPLHPVMTDVPIGAWTMGVLFDLLGMRRSADAAITAGVVSAVPTAIAGMADWSETEGQARRVGVMHAVLNSASLMLYIGSLLARRSGQHGLGVGLSTTAYAINMASAYLGGELVYKLGTGVNRTAWQPHAAKFQVAARLEDLADGEPARGEITVDGTPIPLVLLKRGREVLALDGTCAHWGGPLDKGKLVEGSCIECPWHGSRFHMETGEVVRGPAAYPQPRYEARIRGGNVEVRRAKN